MNIIQLILSALEALFASFGTKRKPEVAQETQDEPRVVPQSFHKNPIRIFDVNHVKKWEGLRLKAYQDVVGVWTIGYGHTKTAKPGMVITEKEAERLLREDLAWAERAVANGVKVAITQPMFDAMVSLCFNIGAGAFAKSTLLRTLNSGDYEGAARQFRVWVKGTDPKTGQKITIKGLVNRRADEEALFRKGM